MTGEGNANNMGTFGTISAEAFKEALDRVYRAGMPPSHLKMIKAQHRAPHATITATELALAAGFKDYRGANLQYGGLSRKIAEILNFEPVKDASGTPLYWTTLSYSAESHPQPETGHFQFVMRPELVEALNQTAWALPLQNRVNARGEIFANASKGDLMGNRGKLHDNQKRLKRQVLDSNRRWLSCKPKFKGIQRELMNPKEYTELFFLDEATAFSAGHRPCYTCQNARYKDFMSIWLAANASNSELKGTSADDIDWVIHEERVKEGNKVTYKAEVGNLPNGTFIEEGGEFFLKWGGYLLKWSFDGYLSVSPVGKTRIVSVLTPKSIVDTFDLGFRPEVHQSAKDLLERI